MEYDLQQNQYFTDQLSSLFSKVLKRNILPTISAALFYNNKIWLYDSSSEFQPVFDLASLTKPLSTSIMILKLVKTGDISLTSTVSSVIKSERFNKEPFNRISILNLLSHNSGLRAYCPYFEYVKDRDDLIKTLSEEKLHTPIGSKTVYSDIGFMLLGLILSDHIGNTWYKIAQSKLYKTIEPPGVLTFNPENIPDQKIVPNMEPEWINPDGDNAKQVHDENARILGKGAGHAGLWANALGLSGFLQLLSNINSDLAKDIPSLLHAKFKKPNSGNRFVLGFDTPEPSGYTSAGLFPRESSFGHLGFTGTAFWFEPKNHLGAVLLSNRVTTGRTAGLNELRQLRPQFFTFAYNFLTMHKSFIS